MGLILEGGNRGERKDDIVCGILKEEKAIHKWTGENRLHGKNHPDVFLQNVLLSVHNLKAKVELWISSQGSKKSK